MLNNHKNAFWVVDKINYFFVFFKKHSSIDLGQLNMFDNKLAHTLFSVHYECVKIT